MEIPRTGALSFEALCPGPLQAARVLFHFWSAFTSRLPAARSRFALLAVGSEFSILAVRFWHPTAEGSAMPRRDIVVVGASAGGIEVLETVLSSLPGDFPGAVFIVLHTSEDSPGCCRKYSIAAAECLYFYAVHNAPILPARIFVAPAGQRHMLLERGKILLQAGPRENRSRPSIDGLFRSASYAYGSQVIGVILTGNLGDGAAGWPTSKHAADSRSPRIPKKRWHPRCPQTQSRARKWILFCLHRGPKLVELASSETAVEVQPICIGDRNMAAGRQADACPECGGVLEEVEESSMLRFRCRVGHMYSRPTA